MTDSSTEGRPVDVWACPTRTLKFFNCSCEICAVCGNRKHTAIHGPVSGKPDVLWGHAFVARDEPQRVTYARVCGIRSSR